MADYDPSSYGHQERDLGQIPRFIPLATFKLHGGQGVPSASLGANGDFYFRTDGAAGASTTIYFKAAGAWTGLTA